MTGNPAPGGLVPGELATFALRGVAAVDPFEGRQGILDLRVEDGRIAEVAWTGEGGGRAGDPATGRGGRDRLLVVP
ncbi:MAG: hypothetical protein H0W07_04430, partial [Chloroflexi bacterium]|nr:hypothetical protein [Chloroflexota bacterium]